ncbi:hypothetical protein D9M68_662740 [compost metagenome]
MTALAAVVRSVPGTYWVPAGTGSRTRTSAEGAPFTSKGVLVGAMTLDGCASCAPMLVPETEKSMRVWPGMTLPG